MNNYRILCQIYKYIHLIIFSEHSARLCGVYENVVSIRLMAAEFPQITASSSPGARLTTYLAIGNNLSATSGYTASTPGDIPANTYYFLLDIEGLNRTDETTVGGNRSTFANGFFAKIPVPSSSAVIQYNDHSAQENIAQFKPALGKLDRLHIRTRLHNQQDMSGFIYWTTNGLVASGSNQKGAEFCLSLEIEYLENSFDDFSSFETRVSDRA